MARVLFKRESENPFYRYNAKGADEEGAQLLLKYCVRNKPTPEVFDGDPLYYVEFDHKMSDGKWKNGGGHYCNFLINVFTQSVE